MCKKWISSAGRSKKELAWFAFRVASLVIRLVESVVFLALLLIQHNRCLALHGRYNYAVTFGSLMYIWAASVVYEILACLHTSWTFRRSLKERLRKPMILMTLLMLLMLSSLSANLARAIAFPEKEYLRTTLTQDIITYNSSDNSPHSSEIDLIQSYFSCCGVDGPKTWQLNSKFNCSSTNGVCGVPQSCCIDQSNWTCGFGVWENETLKSSIYEDGCQTKIEGCFFSYATVLGDILAMLLALDFLLIFCSEHDHAWTILSHVFLLRDRSRLVNASQYIRDSHVPVEQPREIASHCSCSSGESTGLSQEETLEQNSYISRQGIQSEQELLSPVTLTADEAEEDMPATAEEISQTILSSENRISPIGELSLTVGPNGGYAHRGDLSLFVPAGAVDEEVTLLAKVYIDKQVFKPVDISKEQFIFSPVLSLEPHGYQFKQPVLVRLPFSAVPGGWHLVLLRADCQMEEDARTWKEIVSYNTDTREVTTDDCQYDVEHALLSVSHFCRHFWCAEALLKEGQADINPEKMLYCSIYGISDGSLNRWRLELNLHDQCDDISKTILKKYRRVDPQWKLLGYQETLTIARHGEIRCEVVSRIWQLTETIQPQSFEHYWSSWFGNNHKIRFSVECPPETPVQDAGGIDIEVQGCPNTAPAIFFVTPVPNRSQDQASPNPPVERCRSVDSGSHSEIGLAVQENYQARTLQPTGQDNPGQINITDYNISAVNVPAGIGPTRITAPRPLQNVNDQAALCSDETEVPQLANVSDDACVLAQLSEVPQNLGVAVEGENENDCI